MHDSGNTLVLDGQSANGTQTTVAVKDPHSLTSQSGDGTRIQPAGEPQHPQLTISTVFPDGEASTGGTHTLVGHASIDTPGSHAAERPTSRSANCVTAPKSPSLTGNPSVLTGHTTHDTRPSAAGEQTPNLQPTIFPATPTVASSAGASHALNGHEKFDDHDTDAVESETPPAPAKGGSIPTPSTLVLADPLLALAADVLDDLEGVRIANENRLRQLTRDVADRDGQERGFGLTLDHPDVARLLAMARALRCNTDFLLKELKLPRTPERPGCCVEHDAERNLTTRIKAHPLGPWMKGAHGVGDKQGARLLAAIGDPYWNDLHNRPRTVYELYAYCGFHVLPVSHRSTGAHISGAAGDLASGRQTTRDDHRCFAAGTQPLADHAQDDTQIQAVGEDSGGHPNHRSLGIVGGLVGVAATRTRGQRINWSPTARMRAYLVAKSIVKAGGPYREVYDRGRAKYTDAVHQVECRRCAPKGHPAPVGSPLSEGHKYARAVRLIAKAVLRDLWREARRLHQESALTP